jgi:hypothetical protein
MTAKQKLINFLSKKKGTNTFTTEQARSWFGIRNVSARISELRQDGHQIQTKEKINKDGTKTYMYQLVSQSNTSKVSTRQTKTV